MAQTAQRLGEQSEKLKSIRKKLFVKTQGSTEMARGCAEQVAILKGVVDGIEESREQDAQAKLDEALKVVEERIGSFVEKTQSLVIRMT